MSDIPTIMTAAGLQPMAPADLRARLVSLVAASNPGYTSDLPGTLIEDIASTDVAALAQCDQMRVALINALTPHDANDFLLAKLGAIYGVPRGQSTNASVQVQFTGALGFPIPDGFVVGDGTYQYVVQGGGVVGAGGSGNLTAIATQPGTWAIPAGSVTDIITSVPAGITLAVTNALPGTPSVAPETNAEYRSQVLRAGLAASQGMARYLKTLLRNVPGVQERLISVRQRPPASGACGAWEIIVGGTADSYQVANAIFNAIFDVSSLVPSAINVTNLTRANPGVVTTDLTHLFTTGQTAIINGLNGMGPLNGVPVTVTVLDPHTFSVGVDTSGYPAWVSGGVVTPNPRNMAVAISDFPDVYQIPFVVPPAQAVDVVVTWNTSALNFVGAGAIAILAAPAIAAYINSIPVGQPLLVYELENTFRNAVSGVLPANLLTRMIFSVSVDGIGVAPYVGTGIIPTDPESYLSASVSSVQVNQG